MEKIPHSERLRRVVSNPLFYAMVGAGAILLAKRGGKYAIEAKEAMIAKKSHKEFEQRVLKFLGSSEKYERMESEFVDYVVNKSYTQKGFSARRLATIMAPLYELGSYVKSRTDLSELYPDIPARQVREISTQFSVIDKQIRHRVEEQLRLEMRIDGVRAFIDNGKVSVQDNTANTIAFASVDRDEDMYVARPEWASRSDISNLALFASLHELGARDQKIVKLLLPVGLSPNARDALTPAVLDFPSKTPSLPNELILYISKDLGFNSEDQSRHLVMFEPNEQTKSEPRYLFI